MCKFFHIWAGIPPHRAGIVLEMHPRLVLPVVLGLHHHLVLVFGPWFELHSLGANRFSDCLPRQPNPKEIVPSRPSMSHESNMKEGRKLGTMIAENWVAPGAFDGK